MAGDRRPGVVLDRDYDGHSRTLRDARCDVVGSLRSHQIGQDLQERAELVVSELASNAIQAAPGTSYAIRVSLSIDGTVVIAVTSSAEDGAPPPREEWGPAHPKAPSGRGLLIVGELTDHVKIERHGAGRVVVTATFGATAPV